MTTKEIQHALFGRFGNGSQLMVPNYTPHRWFECDLFRVTKAGRSDEFEIKLSVADFKADAKKGPDEREVAWRLQMNEGGADWSVGSKHERLASGDQFGPNRFWFVVPEEMASKVVVPVWAGLLTVRTWRKQVMLNRTSGDACEGFRPAPLLHRAYCPEKVTKHALGVFYYRYWNLRRGQKEEGAA